MSANPLPLTPDLQERLRQADIVVAEDEATGKQLVVYGLQLVKDAAAGNHPSDEGPALLITIDFATHQLEALAAWCRVLKGRHDLPIDEDYLKATAKTVIRDGVEYQTLSDGTINVRTADGADPYLEERRAADDAAVEKAVKHFRWLGHARPVLLRVAPGKMPNIPSDARAVPLQNDRPGWSAYLLT